MYLPPNVTALGQPIEQLVIDGIQAAHKQTDDHITGDDVTERLNGKDAGLGNEQLTDAEIIQRVRDEAESGDEEANNAGEESTKSVKHAEAMQAFNTCLAWADENNIPDSHTSSTD